MTYVQGKLIALQDTIVIKIHECHTQIPSN